MVLLIDNYDSFTYNIVQRLGELDRRIEVEVHRNDKITADQVEAKRPGHIIISPGPCTPAEGGVSNEVLKRFAGKVPILGVCLGHQCMGFTFGGPDAVVRADRVMHGKTSEIYHDGKGVFAGLGNPFTATRYHSLIVRPDRVPADFEVCAWTDQKEIMGLRHKKWPLFGVQFHPESFLTIEGPKLLANFLRTRPAA
jgi:anthranilate synthase/aminodeoxychorismate synthase-like glutamine amidotransferase